MPRYVLEAQNQETIAAIDLGSNALRAIIVKKNKDGIEVIRNYRVPVRLGEDVFNHGVISPEKMQLVEETFITLFQAFIEHNVTSVRAAATSAMRDASNGHILAREIAHTTGIDIETIHGKAEARLIFKAVQYKIPLKKKTALLMDIGGGSTELIIVMDEKIVAVHSFDVGTVRLLQSATPVELTKKIESEVKRMNKFIQKNLGKKKLNVLIGTGGNLRRIGKIRKKLLNKSSELALLPEISAIQEAILSMSRIDRQMRLELDQNRADVILPAILLIDSLMKQLKLKKILLPPVGLKEGLILSMLDEVPEKFILKD